VIVVERAAAHHPPGLPAGPRARSVTFNAVALFDPAA
jgi:hypothetical protein